MVKVRGPKKKVIECVEDSHSGERAMVLECGHTVVRKIKRRRGPADPATMMKGSQEDPAPTWAYCEGCIPVVQAAAVQEEVQAPAP